MERAKKKEEPEVLSGTIEDKVWVQVEQSVQPRQYESLKIIMGTSRTIGNDDPKVLRQLLMGKLIREVLDGMLDALDEEEEQYKRR